MSRHRRILFYSCLILLAGGLLAWQWRNLPIVQSARLNTLLEKVHDPDPAVRAITATTLGELGRDSDRAWNELATMALYDTDDAVRAEAGKVLQDFCQSRAAKDEPKRLERKRVVVLYLLDGFKMGNVEVRRRVPEIVYAVTGLEFHERTVRRATDDAVDKKMRPVAVSELIRALKDPDEEVREESVRYLGKLSKLPVEAEPGLLDELRSQDAVSRGGAALALSNLRNLSDDAIPGLIDAVQDDSPDVRLSAFHCLVRIGPKAAPAIKATLAKTTDKTRRGYLELCLKAFDLAKAG